MGPQLLRYEADGLQMEGQLFSPSTGGPRGLVLLFPEALGLGDHAIGRGERLAGEGFTVLACDLYGEGRFFEKPADMAEAFGEIRADARRVVARADGAYRALSKNVVAGAPKVAAIGHCFGGTMALELARSGVDLAAVIGFHCGLRPLSGVPAKHFTSPVLVCIGADDPSIPPSQRAAFEDEMRAAGASWRMSLFGGVVHSFTNPMADRLERLDFARYDAEADRVSWAEMLDVLDAAFPRDT